MFNFTPLLGAQSSSPASQSLLEFEGGVKVLIDVGWDAEFNVSKLKELERHVPTLSLVLLTHATPAHIGAFAYCCKNIPSFTQVPVYATDPVIYLGRTLLQDLYISAPAAASSIPSAALGETALPASAESLDRPCILRQPPTLEEIASYFALINPLKYSQPRQPLPSPFSPPLNGLTITAYNAGHSLGGTIWHIQHGMESVVYAVDWNHIKENVFSGAAWLSGSGAGGAEVIEQLHKPTALICSTRGAEKTSLSGGRAKRDELLLGNIRTALAKGGTVLIPTDSSARVLELAYLLEHVWRKECSKPEENAFKQSKSFLASRTIGTTMRYARSMMEWMDENVVQEFEASAIDNVQQRQNQHRRSDSRRNNNAHDGQGKAGGPFEFRYLKLVERKSQVEKLLSIPGSKVILASDTSMIWGFSKEILMRIASEPTNLIILTEDMGPQPENPSVGGGGGLCQIITNWYHERRDGVAVETREDGQTLEQVHTGGRDLVARDANRQPLQGTETALYQQFLANQRQLQNTHTGGTNLENAGGFMDDASSESSSSSEESDSEQQGKSLNFSATMMQANRNKTSGEAEVQGIMTLLRKPGCYDWDVRGKKGREAVFPMPSRRKKIDEYGELIRPEEYLRAEEREEGGEGPETDILAASGKDAQLGQKRKWEDTKATTGIGKGVLGLGKRHRMGKNQNEDLASNHFSTDTKAKRDDMATGTDEKDDEMLSSASESESEPEEENTAPSKLTYSTRTVQAHLRIALVDFSGLHDQRSLSLLIPWIQPRKLVLIGGTASETQWLAEECRQKLRPSSDQREDDAANDISTPSVGETVIASMDTNAWTVRLSEALVRRIHWQNVRGLGIVTLTGRLAATPALSSTAGEESDLGRRKRPKIEENKEVEPSLEPKEEGKDTKDTFTALPPTLDVLPSTIAVATAPGSSTSLSSPTALSIRTVRYAGGAPLHVGDLRLADLRRILQAGGHAAEFRGEGTLVVDGLVAVRKSAGGGGGTVDLEGAPALDPSGGAAHFSSFQAVKQRIYDGLAVIAGG